MNILVTGGAGFIGSAFVRLALKTGLPGLENLERITVLDSLTYSGNLNNLADVSFDQRLIIKIGNINDLPLLQDSLFGVDIIFHFAAESHVDRSINNANLFVETNIIGSYNIFNEAHKAKIPMVVHISTDEVYGSINSGSFVEGSNLEPNSPYAASKASSDLLARSFFKTHQLPVKITRCSNNYGPFQHPEKLIPLSITNLLRGRKIPVYGNGLNEREWIHVDDHCRGIALIATTGKIGEIYNIGGNNRITNIELVNKIVESMGFEKSRIEFVEDRKGHDFRYALNNSKIANLGHKESIDFETGLADLVKWYESNEAWWNPLLG